MSPSRCAALCFRWRLSAGFLNICQPLSVMVEPASNSTRLKFLPLNKSYRVTASSSALELRMWIISLASSIISAEISVAVFRPSFMNSTLPRYMMIISDIATLKLHIRQLFRNELFELSFVVFCILDSDTMFLQNSNVCVIHL